TAALVAVGDLERGGELGTRLLRPFRRFLLGQFLVGVRRAHAVVGLAAVVGGIGILQAGRRRGQYREAAIALRTRQGHGQREVLPPVAGRNAVGEFTGDHRAAVHGSTFRHGQRRIGDRGAASGQRV